VYFLSGNIYILLENTATTRNNRIIDIYNEDEEMTPVIDKGNEERNDINMETEEVSEDDIELDIDSDEVSEDDIELESEYDRMMTEFNERDEYQDDREEMDGDDEGTYGDDEEGTESEEDLDEEVIVDKPLSGEQLPQFFNEFAPYFKNITESLFFCWTEKHHICI